MHSWEFNIGHHVVYGRLSCPVRLFSRYLLERGATPQLCDADCVSRYLLERGANPQLCDEEQNTGLHWAAFSGSMEIAELFLHAGCRVNSPNVHGDTPLHIAARQRHYQCTLLMLAHGANLYLRNKEGNLALDCCGPDRTDTRLALLLNMELNQLANRTRGKRGERVLSNDVSRGKEKLPIQAVNECDDSPLPTDYTYVAESCETMKLNIDRTITSLQVSGCGGGEGGSRELLTWWRVPARPYVGVLPM